MHGFIDLENAYSRVLQRFCGRLLIRKELGLLTFKQLNVFEKVVIV